MTEPSTTAADARSEQAAEHAVEHGRAAHDTALAPAEAHEPGAAPGEAGSLEQLFEDEELKQFDHEDVAAGGNIGRMLAFFFLYTVIVMSIVALWTYSAISD